MSKSALAFKAALYAMELPQDVDKAMQDVKWRKAMEEEIDALRKNETWEKCILPKEKKIVGCKWVYTVKYKADGSIEW